MLRLVTVFALAGCGGSPTSPAQPTSDVPSNHESTATADRAKPLTETELALAKLAEFQTEMCACKDARCAKGVSDDMAAFSTDFSKRHPQPAPLGEREQKRATAIIAKLSECMQTALGYLQYAPSSGSAAP